jgi:NAD(P)-dependent dehydrogenase (short-subunit alcohol dehydrogenase family)
MPAAKTRTAIVTGGTAGIGRATVLALSAAGFDVGFTFQSRGREARRLVESVARDGRRAVAVQLMLEDASRVTEAISELIHALGGVDVLVNNAGANRRRSFLAERLEEWQRILDVNLTGAFLCAQAAARAMVERGHGGRIINVTSVLERVPIAGGAAYCSSKAALEMLSRVMALELAPHGITVNSVAPGHTATPMNYGDDDAAASERPLPMTPPGRAADPAEIASCIRFLASVDASYITGACVLVDGGLLLRSGPDELQRGSPTFVN